MYRKNRFFIATLLLTTCFLVGIFLTDDTPKRVDISFITFPNENSGKDLSPGWTHFRAEGKSLLSTIFSSFDYLKKYSYKKRICSPEEAGFFKLQKQLIAEFRKSGYKTDSLQSARLGLTGDIMWIRNGWNDFVGKDVKTFMDKADFWVGNLESPVVRDKKVPCFFPDYASYNSDSGLITSFRNTKGSNYFKILSLANNHLMDQGDEGIKATISFLKENRIQYSGLSEGKQTKQYKVVEVNGIRFGFYAACWGLNNAGDTAKTSFRVNILPGLAPKGKTAVDLTEIREVLMQMSADGIDFKIISLHWGYEYEFYPDPLQVDVAHQIVTAGADLILGHHPHVIQPMEICFINGYEKTARWKTACNSSEIPVTSVLSCPKGYPRKALVIYSAGNFTTAMYTVLCQAGLMQIMEVYRDKAGIVDWNFDDYALVYNKKSYPPNGTHHLMLLDNYLNSNLLTEKKLKKTKEQLMLMKDLTGL